MTFSSFHESVTGWSTLFMPAVSYTINDVFSVDGTIPVYMFRLADSLSARPRPDARLVSRRGEFGDAIFALHAQFEPKLFSSQTTFSMTVPTGDDLYGLTTGRATFDLNNQFSRSYGRLTPSFEIGVGDSATLVNRQLNKTYTSLGPLAHFQVGLGTDLLRRVYFESGLYEQLPIGDQKIYRAYRRGRPTVVIGHNVVEDNGFINTLDIPLSRNTILSGYYSRSLRHGLDTAGVSITFVLRGATKDEGDMAFDELIR